MQLGYPFFHQTRCASDLLMQAARQPSRFSQRTLMIAIPMIMVALMTGPYLMAWCFLHFFNRKFDLRSAAAMGLGALFVFTAIGHFTQTLPMSRMLPSWVPQPTLLVHSSGILELVVALGFLWAGTRKFAGWSALGILTLFFPVNIYAAVNHVDMGGHALGPVYLLIRGPLQLVILWWVYVFTIKEPRKRTTANSQAPTVRI